MATMVEEVGQSLTEREELGGGLKEERIPDPCIVVIFGASGDLTKRKLLPALFHLEQQHLLATRRGRGPGSACPAGRRSGCPRTA